MLKTVKAIIDRSGTVRILESIQLESIRHALVTILDDTLEDSFEEMVLLSEPALAVDWTRPEEDHAWSHLQVGR